jgi:hypothetical protein
MPANLHRHHHGRDPRRNWPRTRAGQPRREHRDPATARDPRSPPLRGPARRTSALGGAFALACWLKRSRRRAYREPRRNWSRKRRFGARRWSGAATGVGAARRATAAEMIAPLRVRYRAPRGNWLRKWRLRGRADGAARLVGAGQRGPARRSRALCCGAGARALGESGDWSLRDVSQSPPARMLGARLRLPGGIAWLCF